MTQLSTTALTRDLRRLVESEELGTSLFAAAAGTSGRHQHSWNMLKELEIQTNAGVAAFIERAGLTLSPTNNLAEGVGRTGGFGLRLLPHHVQLRVVRAGTTRYLPAFRRLAAHYAGTGEARFFDYVVEHELAIIEYTERALSDSTSALDPVRRLLDRDVPGTPRVPTASDT